MSVAVEHVTVFARFYQTPKFIFVVTMGYPN